MTASDITDSRPDTAAGADADKAANLELMASLIAEITGLPKDSVVPEADLVDDLYIDSVAKIELMVACETRFGVQIPDEIVNELRDVEAVLDYLAEHKAAS
ncbi:acyl carrier protein [Streptomyces sp. NPDC060209]|uniref:acyl carrier protein n=1 Tax=Streptomyces sp. NPDC060209 TaxID=3347073 RepID=UPI00364B0CD5